MTQAEVNERIERLTNPERIAWALHEMYGCPLRADAHDPDTGWCSRQQQLSESAQKYLGLMGESDG